MIAMGGGENKSEFSSAGTPSIQFRLQVKEKVAKPKRETTMQREDKTMTHEEFKKSVEARFCRNRAWIFLGCYLLIMAFTSIAIPASSLRDTSSGLELFGFIAIGFGLFFVPMSVFYFYRWLAPYRHPERYEVHTVRFTLPEGAPFFSPRFSFELTLADGQRVTATTHAVFLLYRGSQETAFYANQDVKIGYDPQRDSVVVLGLVSANGQARS